MEEPQSWNFVFLYYIPMCLASLAAFTCGTVLGWTSPTIPKLNGQLYAKNNPLLEPLTKQQETWLGSLLPLGATFGAIFAGLLVNQISLKKSFTCSMIPLVLAFPISFYAASLKMFYLFRFLSGLGVGSVFTVLSIFIGKIEDDNGRKYFGFLIQLFVKIGILYSYVVGSLEIQFQLFNFLCLTAPMLFMVLLTIFVVKSIFVTIDKANDVEVKSKMNKTAHEDLEYALNKITKDEDNILEIFKSLHSIKEFVISITLVAVQQLSGIYVVLFYTDTIFRESKTFMLNSKYSTITIGMVLISANLYVLITNKKNELQLFIAAALGMGIAHGLLSLYFYLLSHQNNMELVFMLPTMSLIMYIFFFSIAFEQLTWTFIGELFPRNVKSMGIALTNSCSWLFAFIATKFFFGFGGMVGIEISFLIFMIICFLGAIVIGFIVFLKNRSIIANNYEILHEEQI